MANLALAYSKQGRGAEALKLCEEILPIGRRVLGPEHPYTLSTMVSLGYEYSKQGMPVKGQKLCEEILPISRRALGPEHPHTLEAIRDLESIQRELESMDTGRGSSTNPAP